MHVQGPILSPFPPVPAGTSSPPQPIYPGSRVKRRTFSIHNNLVLLQAIRIFNPALLNRLLLTQPTEKRHEFHVRVFADRKRPSKPGC